MVKPNKRQLKRRRKALARQKWRLQRYYAALAIVKPHPCDGCTACCTCVGVEELRKPYYSTCSFCDEHGCVAYESRPPSCTGYECLYTEGVIGERSDRCGILFSPEMREHLRVLAVYEVRPNVFLNSLDVVFEVLEKVATLGAAIDRAERYRFGAEIPTAWEGQHFRLKTVSWDDPGAAYQVHFAVRADQEEEDTLWWCLALSKCSTDLVEFAP